jgi:hypothetical protein
MSQEPEEFSLDWLDGPKLLECGTYIWVCAITSMSIRDIDREKPYALLGMKVIEGEQAGFSWEYRLYINKAAKGWARYFLSKFGYPPELLAGENPTLRRSALVDPTGNSFLSGKVHVEVVDDPKWGRQYNAKGFDRPDGEELEKKLERQQEVALPKDDVPAVDLEADVKKPAAQEDLSFLDGPYQATDDDLPENMK